MAQSTVFSAAPSVQLSPEEEIDLTENFHFLFQKCPKGFGLKVAKLRLKTPSKIAKLNKRIGRSLVEVQAGTYRTFPVPRNIPRNVPLFLVSSVFPYSKGEEGR